MASLHSITFFKHKFFISVVALSLATLVGIFLFFNEHRTVYTESLSHDLNLRLEKNSPEKAYYELKKEYLEKSSEEQHHIIHNFGQSLYKKIGLEAITICDSAFAFGCFHGVFSEAVKDKGLNVISDLDRICEERFGSSKLGCPHGIGHGILEHLGSEKLNPALSLCENLSSKKASLECDTGVFMEYYFPANPHHEGRTIRELSDDIYAPCSRVKDDHKNACFYIIVQWWDKIFESDKKKLGILCSELKNLEHKEACFLGIGDILADINSFDPNEVIKDCNLMPGEYNQILCRSGAKGIFHAVLNYRHLSGDLCLNLKPDMEKVCHAKSNFFLLE